MKLLFLDIDGVINSVQANSMFNKFRDAGKIPDHYRPYRDDEFCPICVSNLINITKEFDDLKIVISSSWRIGTTLEQLQDYLEPLGISRDLIIDKTPYFPGEERGYEIFYWLKENNHTETKYVVLDDDSDMTLVWNNFFKTDNYVGLDYRVAQKVIEHFKNNDTNSTEKPVSC